MTSKIQVRNNENELYFENLKSPNCYSRWLRKNEEEMAEEREQDKKNEEEREYFNPGNGVIDKWVTWFFG